MRWTSSGCILIPMSNANLVVVEIMPDHHRGSHRAARNWGSYPHNGALRFAAEEDTASSLVSDDVDGYNSIVSGADPAEYPAYEGE